MGVHWQFSIKMNPTVLNERTALPRRAKAVGFEGEDHKRREMVINHHCIDLLGSHPSRSVDIPRRVRSLSPCEIVSKNDSVCPRSASLRGTSNHYRRFWSILRALGARDDYGRSPIALDAAIE
jgi:hypothetical protein